MTFKVLVLVALLLTPAMVAFSQTDRAADAAAIRAHIESIFQAFIDGDIEKIFATHSEDWRGLLEGTSKPIKGIDEYMWANGIEWPRPKDAPKSRSYYPAGTTYKIGDFDVHVVRNEPSYVIQGQVEDLFSDSRPDDVLLLHFSCHGVKNFRER